MLQVGTHTRLANISAQHILSRALTSLSQIGERLATMRRINRGSDDPAGLIALSQLNREITSLEEASEAADRARALVQVADSSMSQVSGLLQDIRGSLVAAADGTRSEAERGALQQQIDGALDALDRIGVTAQWTGQPSAVAADEGVTVLVGPEPSHTAQLSLLHLSSGSLGGEAGRLSELRSGGSASVSAGDLARSLEIVDQAQGQVLQARAEAGAFERYTLEASREVASQTAIQLSDAASRIGDADVALESSRLVRSLLQRAFSLSAIQHGNRNQRLLSYLLN